MKYGKTYWLVEIALYIQYVYRVCYLYNMYYLVEITTRTNLNILNYLDERLPGTLKKRMTNVKSLTTTILHKYK